MIREFYTYMHIKPNGEVFYIGKGKDGRAFDKRGRNRFWNFVVDKYEDYKIIIIDEFLTNEEALSLEKIYIKLYGRRDLKTGSLVNLTDGGEGPCGYRHTESYKKNKSNSMKGVLNHFYNKKHTIQSIELIKSNQPTQLFTEETRQKLSDNSHKKNLVLNILTGIFYESIKEAAEYNNINFHTLRGWLYNKNRVNKSNIIII